MVEIWKKINGYDSYEISNCGRVKNKQGKLIVQPKDKDEKIAVDAYLKFLEDRFRAKIEPKNYCLSYSGGKDSHLLYWFIKEWLHDEEITIIGVNTGFELPEIRNRIIKNCDVVLHPVLKRGQIKKKYGIPCFNKQQDEYIYRYQHGSRSENTMRVVLRKNPMINLNKKALNILKNPMM